MTALALVLLAAPAQVRLLAPPDGFRAGHEQIVGIAVVDDTGALDPSAAAPSLSASGGKAGEPVKVTDGLWEAIVTPGSSGTMTLDAKSGGTKGQLSSPVRASDEAVLRVTLSKDDLAPGDAAPVATIVAKDPAGAPWDAGAPAIDITGGSIAAPVKSSPGTWTAKIKLPDRRFPQALLVVATLPGHDARPAAAVLTMRGKAVVSISTEPHAKVTLRVGKKSYGPLNADQYGELKPEIVASPSDLTYDIESEDSAGNKNTKTVALDVPSYDRLWARADASPAWLDGRTRVRLEAIGLDKKGALRHEEITGTVEGAPIGMTGDAEFWSGEGRMPLPPGDHAGVVTAAGETQKVGFKVTRAPPVAIRIVAVPDAVSSKGTPSAVTAQLVDGAGNPVPDGSIGLSVEGLALSGAKTAPGTSTGNVSLMKGAAPATAGTLQLSAKADGPGFVIRARRTIPVQAGPPAKAAMTGDVPKMIADGSSVAEIGTRIVDSDDYPVTGLTPTATSTKGQVLNLHDAGDGLYKFTLRAPPPNQAGTARVIVQAGDARAETTIVFQKPPTRQSLAAGAGYQTNLGALSSPVAWVEGRRSLGMAEGPWTLTARAQLARGAFDVHLGANYAITVTRESGYLGIRRRLVAVKGWQVTGAGALGAGMVQVQQDPPGFAKSGVVPGGRVALGFEHASGRGSLVVETGYEYAVGPSNVISGQLGGVGLSVGYRHGF